jgi:hypothetical protein
MIVGVWQLTIKETKHTIGIQEINDDVRENKEGVAP